MINDVGKQSGQRAGVGMAVDVVRVGEGAPDPVDQGAHGGGSLGEQSPSPCRQRWPLRSWRDRCGGHQSSPRGLVARTRRVRSQHEQPRVELEAPGQPVRVPAEDLVLLVQPKGQRPVFLLHRALIDPALVVDGDTLDLAPPGEGE